MLKVKTSDQFGNISKLAGFLTICFVLLCLTNDCKAQTQDTITALKESPVYQLRIYEIFEPNKKAFHDRFRIAAMRIMAKYDFHILAIWESKQDSTTEFVYLLKWPDELTRRTKWAEFMKDEEWISIKRETSARHGKMVGNITDRVLKLTDYSPLQ